MRRGGPSAGRRGGRGVRHLSPPTGISSGKMNDNRSDWRRDRFIQQPRRSLSPPSRGRPRHSPGRRSNSVERRDCAPRRSDHWKQYHNESPSPHLHHRSPSPFRSDEYEIPRRYLGSDDTANLYSDVNSSSKLSRVIKDREYLPPGNGASGVSALGLETQSVLHQKRFLLDDGLEKKYYTLPADSSYSVDAALLKHEIIGRSRMPLEVGRHDYHDRLRNPYVERQDGKVYTADASFATSPLLRSYGGASSSSIPKNDFRGLYDDRPRQRADDFIRDRPSKSVTDTLGRVGYSQMEPSDIVTRAPLSPTRIEPQYYGYDEYSQIAQNNHEFLGSSDKYPKIPWGSRSDHRDKIGSSFRDLGVRIAELDVAHNDTSENRAWHKQHSFRGDAALDYHEVKGNNLDFLDGPSSGHLGYSLKPSRVHETAEETYASGTVSAPSYREKPNSPTYYGYRRDIYEGSVRSPRGESEMDDLYQMPPERITRRKYVTDSHIDKLDTHHIASNHQTVFRTSPSLGETDDVWPTEERPDAIHSRRMPLGHAKYKMFPRRESRSDDWSPSEGIFRHVEHGHGMKLKKRLRPDFLKVHGPYSSKKKKEVIRPYKPWKKNLVDHPRGLNCDAYTPNDSNIQEKKHPAEGSEEFKQQVHKSFLRFFKLLNENPQQLKIYREQGQGGLLCFACGNDRSSKEFLDTHNLVCHLYHSGKFGLKTEHLGLHKALCLLMDWNWAVAPDNSKVYQAQAAADAKALKEDLILWPPIVVVHNSCIRKKVKNGEEKVLSAQGIQEMLREMGFEDGKMTICLGKSANHGIAINHSVFLIKFSPTFSGLQEAERLHKHFANNQRGRGEFIQRTSNRSCGDSQSESCFRVYPFIYGYMAVAEDLPKLDSETMKRCLVKSKKDIEAIADAPLNVD